MEKFKSGNLEISIYETFKNSLLKFTAPAPNNLLNVFYSLGIKRFTRLSLGLSRLRGHSILGYHKMNVIWTPFFPLLVRTYSILIALFPLNVQDFTSTLPPPPPPPLKKQ